MTITNIKNMSRNVVTAIIIGVFAIVSSAIAQTPLGSGIAKRGAPVMGKSAPAAEERQLNGNHNFWAHSAAAWNGMPGDGADYTTGANGCAEIVGSDYLSDLEACSHYFTKLIFPKDTTLTSWQIESVGSYNALFSCALRLIDGDGTVIADSEIAIESTYSTGHRFTRTVNHFFDASDISQRHLSVQVKEATTCAAGANCTCDASGISIIRFFGTVVP
jgi:hypothetical protein